MKRLGFTLLAAVAATPLMAQEQRQMGAHVHGTSALDIAVEDNRVSLDLHAPGMDIVGFEYEAATDADKDAVEAAIGQFLRPDEIVTLPDAAGCRLSEVLAHLHAGDHDHEDADAHAAGEDHAHAEGEDHAEGETHAEGESHDHADGEEHSEFHVRYEYTCDDTGALTTITFPFFERFEGAQQIAVQHVTAGGAGAAQLTRDAAQLTLE